MQRIRRHLLVWSLLSIVLLAPLTAPAGAAGDATIDGNSTDHTNWSSDHRSLDGERSIRDAVRNITNATIDVLVNGTDGNPIAEPNASGDTDPPSPAHDDLGDALDLDGTSSGSPDGASSGREILGHGADGPPAVLRPELPRLAVIDGALVVELRTLAVGDLPTVALPLAVDESSDPAVGDGSRQSVDYGDAVGAGVGADGPNDGAGPRVDPTSTSAAENRSAGAGDGAAGGGSTASDRSGLAAGVPVEFAPPLGTALFVVAVRPWLGLLSGAATAVANWLGNAFVLLRYGSHDGSDPLEHETRERIHERVSEAPGRSLTELSEALETPLSTVRHHVRVLERERVVVSRKLRGNRRIYPLGAENAELAAALDEDSSAAVISVLHEQGRATVGEVVDRVEKSYGTVSYHLSRLADEGLVVQEREGRKTLSRLDPDVASLLDAPDDSTAAAAERSGREASAD